MLKALLLSTVLLTSGVVSASERFISIDTGSSIDSFFIDDIKRVSAGVYSVRAISEREDSRYGYTQAVDCKRKVTYPINIGVFEAGTNNVKGTHDYTKAEIKDLTHPVKGSEAGRNLYKHLCK